ncbi:MAG: MmgE/PrpD family protein, partial [Candidatus Saccharibacteria bacterium]|nr:MmgE/PrpD family protein [Pseudorhodobacter sp.]
LRTSPRWLSVCDIQQPRTGLEVKFSYAWLAAMVLSGIPTASDRVYTDALAYDPALAAFAAKITASADPAVTDMQAVGEVTLIDGSTLPFAHDLSARLSTTVLESSLRAKANGMLGAEAGQVWQLGADLDHHMANDLGTALRAS